MWKEWFCHLIFLLPANWYMGHMVIQFNIPAKVVMNPELLLSYVLIQLNWLPWQNAYIPQYIVVDHSMFKKCFRRKPCTSSFEGFPLKSFKIPFDSPHEITGDVVGISFRYLHRSRWYLSKTSPHIPEVSTVLWPWSNFKTSKKSSNLQI